MFPYMLGLPCLTIIISGQALLQICLRIMPST